MRPKSAPVKHRPDISWDLSQHTFSSTLGGGDFKLVFPKPFFTASDRNNISRLNPTHPFI